MATRYIAVQDEEHQSSAPQNSGGGCQRLFLTAMAVGAILIFLLAGLGGSVFEANTEANFSPALNITNIDTINSTTNSASTTNNTTVLPPSGSVQQQESAVLNPEARPGECVYSGGLEGQERFVMYPDDSKPDGYGYAYYTRAGFRIELGPPAGKVSCTN